MGHPVYVTAIDADSNTVWVGENQELFRDKLAADDVHYVSGIPLNCPTELSVKIRYSSQRVPALVIPLGNNRLEVAFHTPQRAITPGQAVVFYDGEQVLGGGTIC
jgi:tRNA-specific 2-thiouridylase